MFLTIIIFVLVLGILVVAHELGHFLAARRFGVKAEEFGFGFPPRLFGWYKSNSGRWKIAWGSRAVRDAAGTVFSLNWIPLGGFVKIKGENGDTKERDSFAGKKYWQRAVMLSAGVVMNVVLAAVIISAGLAIGLPQIIDGLPASAKVRNRQIQIVDVLPNSPAASAGVAVGDFLVDINDQKFATYSEVQDYVAARTGQTLTYTLRRGQQIFDQEITPQVMESTDRGGIGIGIADVGIVRYPLHLALWQGVQITVGLLWMIILGFWGLLSRLFGGQNVSGEVTSFVGIARLTGQMVDMGWVYVVQFTAVLSLNLAIINILPIPALDGGRLLFLAAEKVRGKPLNGQAEAMIHNIFFVLLLALILFITYNDIAKLGCLSCRLNSLFN